MIIKRVITLVLFCGLVTAIYIFVGKVPIEKDLTNNQAGTTQEATESTSKEEKETEATTKKEETNANIQNETNKNDKNNNTNQSGSTEASNGVKPNQIAPASKYTGGALPYCARVSDSYFKDAVFVGDSVTLKLKYYNGLPGASYLCAGSFGSGNALNGVCLPNGRPIEDSVKALGKKRVYIMLGMNDLNVYGISGSVANLRTLCYRILAKSPGALIYIESMTPTIGKTVSNDAIHKYNQQLSTMARSNGWYFVDVASVMYDDHDKLKMEYCSDPQALGLHFNNAGCAAWVSYLYTHAYDPSWAAYNLKITYKMADGSNAPSAFSKKYKAGDSFEIKSPTVKGYTPDKKVVKGKFEHANQSFVVTYKKNPEPTTKPTTKPTTTKPTTTKPTTTKAETTTTTIPVETEPTETP